MAYEMRNQNPQAHYEIARNRFFMAYHQPTSGSAGAGILKWLHEDMNVMSESAHFSALERAATVLQEKGEDDPHPLLFSQIIGAFNALMRDWKDANMPKSQVVVFDPYSDGKTSLDDWSQDVVGGNV